MFLQANYVALYYSLYSINVKSLTEDYCEKLKPCCNAKCYLDKQVNEDSDVSKNKNLKTENKLVISEYVVQKSLLLPFLSDKKKYFTYKTSIVLSDFYPEIEYPPQS